MLSHNIRLVFLLIASLSMVTCSKDETPTGTKGPSLAQLQINAVSQITQTSAQLNAEVVDEGGSAVIVRGFCWSKSPNPSVSNDFSVNAFGPGVYFHTLSNLENNTPYYVKAYATNGEGTVYSNEISFKTTHKNYSIGEIGPGGGMVFDADSNGHGLEVSPTNTEAFRQWGCVATEISGTSVAKGSGQANTTQIINACSETNIAARHCDQLVSGGKSDWYLPSRDELSLIYNNLVKQGKGTFAGNYFYWSSSQSSSTKALTIDMNSGTSISLQKGELTLVRAIRTF